MIRTRAGSLTSRKTVAFQPRSQGRGGRPLRERILKLTVWGWMGGIQPPPLLTNSQRTGLHGPVDHPALRQG